MYSTSFCSVSHTRSVARLLLRPHIIVEKHFHRSSSRCGSTLQKPYSTNPCWHLFSYREQYKYTSSHHFRGKKERLEKPKDCPSRPKTVYVGSSIPNLLWNAIQCADKISNNIVDIFSSYGKPYQILLSKRNQLYFFFLSNVQKEKEKK